MPADPLGPVLIEVRYGRSKVWADQPSTGFDDILLLLAESRSSIKKIGDHWVGLEQDGLFLARMEARFYQEVYLLTDLFLYIVDEKERLRSVAWLH